MTDEMQVAIAGRAALMTIGLDQPYYFDRVPDIIVYAKPFYITPQQASRWSTHPVFGFEVNEPRLGEAWHRGPIVLAWQSIVDPYDDDGYHVNVVVHEFTHHLDGLDGDMSGTPPISDVEQQRDWHRVTEADFLELVGRARRDEATVLSHYGATNRAEFFAVSTECFFDCPHDLRQQHPHLYEVLARYFRQSPADYLPRYAQPPIRRGRSGPEPRRGRKKKATRVFDDPFTQGLVEYQEGELEAAIEAFTAAIDKFPDDSEAYAARALAHLDNDDLQEALADAEVALSLDSEDGDALAVAGAARALLGNHEAALADLRLACQISESSMARQFLGYTYLELRKAKRAVQELSFALSMDPYDAQTYRWRAEAYRQLGDAARAASDEDKSQRLEPDFE